MPEPRVANERLYRWPNAILLDFSPYLLALSSYDAATLTSQAYSVAVSPLSWPMIGICQSQRGHQNQSRCFFQSHCQFGVFIATFASPWRFRWVQGPVLQNGMAEDETVRMQKKATKIVGLDHFTHFLPMLSTDIFYLSFPTILSKMPIHYVT